MARLVASMVPGRKDLVLALAELSDVIGHGSVDGHGQSRGTHPRNVNSFLASFNNTE